MKKMRKVMGLLRVNWRTIVEFEILYKLLSFSIFTPVFWGIFNGIMRMMGYEYLTIENILSFLINPVTLAVLLVLFVCMAVYTMIDIGAVIFLLDQSYQGKKADLLQTVGYAVRNAVRVFQRKNILIVFAVLFLIPFLNIGVASSYVGSIAVPEFILDFIKGNARLLLLFLVALAGLGIVLLRWMYAFHYFTLEGCGFKEARKKSADLGSKSKLKDLAVLLGIQLGISVLFFVPAMAGIWLAVLLGGLFSRLKLFGIVSASVVWVYLAVSLLVVSMLGTPVSYACISILFYGHKEEKKEAVIHGEADGRREKEKGKKIRYAVEGGLLAVSVVCCCFYLYGVYNHKVTYRLNMSGQWR
ncbi:glycerophosphoryl diester phosphodiesterase membrane domain-containing protein [Lachnospiraceae bacterium 47-T17]